MSSLKFKKEERLKSKKIISNLFQHGDGFNVYPLRFVWTTIENDGKYPVKFAQSVPKKKFPTAVSRNKIRRKIREAYRLNKSTFYQMLEDSGHQSIALMLLYIAKDENDYHKIEKAILKGFKKLISKKKPD